jgi:hypothetical protein
VIYYGVSARHMPETPEGLRVRNGSREAQVAEAAQDGWFAGQTGTSASAEESERVTARLATPSDDATRSGLPLRRSRAHLVPGAYESGAEPSPPRRSPEELRERMRGYRSGPRRPTSDDQGGATV